MKDIYDGKSCRTDELGLMNPDSNDSGPMNTVRMNPVSDEPGFGSTWPDEPGRMNPLSDEPGLYHTEPLYKAPHICRALYIKIYIWALYIYRAPIYRAIYVGPYI